MRLREYFDVSQSPDVSAFESRLVAFGQAMGFGIVSGALVIEHPGPSRPASFISVGNTPEAFVTNYQNLADSLRDPVLRRMKHLSVPFLYDQDLYTSEDAGDLWEQQAPYGYRTGISVALHLPGHRHFLLGMDRQQPLPRDERRLTRLFADLQLLAVHAQDAAQRLLAPLADREPAPRLTERELEVLRWTMDGKSAWAVGEILGISEHTVNFHLRNVFSKLGASSKHQAVLKALALGLI
jgi:DNA-binding CsgD family transcriptional regulator